MSRIAFVGDLHLSGEGPVSRKETPEQYRKVLLGKLDDIEQSCLSNGISTIVFLGDMFNNNTGISNAFEGEIWSKLLEIKSKGIGLYTVVGNHDMFFQNDNEFKGTYLFKTFLLGIVEHLDTLDIDGVSITGVDYSRDFIPVSRYSKYNICVAHCFYENEQFGGIGNGNLTDDKCKALGYNAYVLGHDHLPYPTVNENTYIVVRPGSITRGTSKTCNLYRKVSFAVFDTTTLEWSSIDVNVKPGLEVFNEKVVIEKSVDVNLNKLLDDFSVTKNMSIYDIIDQKEQKGREVYKERYDDIIDIITIACESEGIYRKKEVEF